MNALYFYIYLSEFKRFDSFSKIHVCFRMEGVLGLFDVPPIQKDR